MRCRRSGAVAIAIIVGSLLGAPSAAAQSAGEMTGPPSGSWGAEASFGAGTSASLLHFSSPRAAWLLGGSFQLGRETEDEPVFPTGRERTTTTIGIVELRLGRRWWSGEPATRLRPLVGLGVAGSYFTQSSARHTQGGVYGELGTTYFFTPHVSLGATGEVVASYARDRSSFSSGVDATRTSWSLSGNLVRLNATVYF